MKNLSLEIGPYQVHPIPTGIFGLDGGAMFGTVPKVLWEKSNPSDANNRIQMEARALLLQSPGHNILIDTGNGGDFIQKYGGKLGPKFAELYNIDSSGPSLLKSLGKYHLKPEDIDTVILTHLHFDHAGGGTCWKNNELVPTFPNAKYLLQKANLQTAQNPNRREKASYFTANYQPLIQHHVLTLLDGSVDEILPGVSLFVSNGHTQGQQIVQISDGKKALLYCGDVIPTSSHIRIPWLMGYDLDPLLLMTEKEQFLKKTESGEWFLFFEHDPYCDVARVEKKNDDYVAGEKYCLA